MERNNPKQNNIKDRIKELANIQLNSNNFMDLYIVINVNTYNTTGKKEFTCDIQQLSNVQKFSEVPILASGLGNGKGLMFPPKENDIVLVAFYGQTNAPIIIGNTFNTFSAGHRLTTNKTTGNLESGTVGANDNILDVNTDEWILINKLNGSYIFTNKDGEILIKNTKTDSYEYPASSGTYYTESFIKLKKDGNIGIKCKGGIGDLNL